MTRGLSKHRRRTVVVSIAVPALMVIAVAVGYTAVARPITAPAASPQAVDIYVSKASAAAGELRQVHSPGHVTVDVELHTQGDRYGRDSGEHSTDGLCSRLHRRRAAARV
jgi:hypothetical protein